MALKDTVRIRARPLIKNNYRMLVFLITVLVVAALLALDKWSSKPKEPIKYTNLDWEIIYDGYYERESHYHGRIYSVVKNKVVNVYDSKSFTSKTDAEKYIKKICQAMRSEYGIVETPDIYNSRIRNPFDSLM